MTTDLDPRDRILQAHTPAVMVPKYGKLPPLEGSGHRYLVAGAGVWLEVRRPWLHAVLPLWVFGFKVELEHEAPFGDVTSAITYAFQSRDVEHQAALFGEQARAALPNEAAAWAVWDEQARELVYMPLEPTEASPTGITFNRPALPPHQHLAIDFHSHGAAPAGFSATDDEDDRGEVKVAIVAGGLKRRDTDWAIRLCLLGLYIDDPVEAMRP